MAQDEKKSTKKKWGWILVVAPIIVFLLIGLANGFSTSQNWTGSFGMDWFLGIIGIVVVIVGLWHIQRKSN